MTGLQRMEDLGDRPALFYTLDIAIGPARSPKQSILDNYDGEYSPPGSRRGDLVRRRSLLVCT